MKTVNEGNKATVLNKRVVINIHVESVNKEKKPFEYDICK